MKGVNFHHYYFIYMASMINDTYPSTYLPTHTPTYLLFQPTYLLFYFLFLTTCLPPTYHLTTCLLPTS